VEADDLRREIIARRDRYRARSETIRRIIDDLLTALEMPSRRAKLATASLGDGQPSLLLTDEELIPAKYWKTERTLMRTPLKDDLLQGVVVPGVVMSNPGTVLRIRRHR
jgi:hypothetical protein